MFFTHKKIVFCKNESREQVFEKSKHFGLSMYLRNTNCCYTVTKGWTSEINLQTDLSLSILPMQCQRVTIIHLIIFK